MIKKRKLQTKLKHHVKRVRNGLRNVSVTITVEQKNKNKTKTIIYCNTIRNGVK